MIQAKCEHHNRRVVVDSIRTQMNTEKIHYRLRAMPWGLVQLVKHGWARLRGRNNIHAEVLAFVKSSARTGDPQSVLSALDVFSQSNRFLMNVGPEKGELIQKLVKEIGPQAKVLELGGFVGYSAILMSQHLGEGGKLISVESHNVSANVVTAMLEYAGLQDVTEVVHMRSDEYINQAKAVFDLVLLDHWMDLYLEDTQKMIEKGLIREGTIIVADNVGPIFGSNSYVDWVQEQADFVSERYEFQLERNRVHDAVLVSRKTSLIQNHQCL